MWLNAVTIPTDFFDKKRHKTQRFHTLLDFNVILSLKFIHMNCMVHTIAQESVITEGIGA